MQNLLYNISQVLGITILHSLWQGLIIFIALRLFLLARPGATSLTKYWVSYAALSVTLGWSVATLFTELGNYDWLSTTRLANHPIILPALIHEVNAPVNRVYFTIAQYMPYITMLYVVGLVFNTMKLGLAWNSIYRIRQNSSDAGLENTIGRLSNQLKVTKFVKVAFSEWVDVPCVTGYIKPIILLPLSINSYLSTKEIEAILLHEMAHIKRNDYLLNFIQQVIGILLFFNPFARLIDKIINQERENCCDDVVVQVAGSPLIYAQALLKLEENKQHQWQLALAATTSKYELLNRIERIMKTKTQTVNIRPVLITVLALTCAITSIAWLNPEIKDGKIGIKNAAAIHKIAAAITAPTPVAEQPTTVANHKKRSVADTTKSASLSDTTHKKSYVKIVVIQENGEQKTYKSIKDLTATQGFSFNDYSQTVTYNKADSNAVLTYRKLSADEIKKKRDEIFDKGMSMLKDVNVPELVKMQKEIMANGLAVTKNLDGDKLKKLAKEMQKSTGDMAAYYKSDEFKKQVKGLAKMYDSPEFKKQMENMGKMYDSPEFKAQMEKIAKTYDSPEFKKQMEDVKARMNSPEFKAQQELLKKYMSSKDFKEKMNSPEFKKQMEEMTKSMGDMGKRMSDMQKDTSSKKQDKKTDDVYPKKPSGNPGDYKEIN